MARSIVSLVMLADNALSTAARRRGLAAGSATPARVATVISRINLVNTLARLASSAFLRPSMDGPLPMAGNLNNGQAGDFTPSRTWRWDWGMGGGGASPPVPRRPGTA